jgi:predicted  nucleic acid-binding Zn ribbon protein
VREEAAQKDNMRGKKLARLSEQISHSESWLGLQSVQGQNYDEERHWSVPKCRK